MPPEPPRRLDRIRFTLRAKHYSYRTEQAYVHWVRRYSPTAGTDIWCAAGSASEGGHK